MTRRWTIAVLSWLFLAVSLPGLLGAWTFLENSDVLQYAAMVAGEGASAPFCDRPAVPWLASLVPVVSGLTALRLMSWLSTLGALLVLDRILVGLRVRDRGRVAGALLFLLSFPTVVYGASAYIDASVLLVLVIGTWSVLSQAWISFALILGLGAFVSEKSVVMLVLGSVVLRWRILPFAFLFLVVWLAMHREFPWAPSMTAIQDNLTPGRWVRVTLSLGVPFLLTAMAVRKHGWRALMRQEEDRVLLGGLGVTLFLVLYAAISSRVDGCFAWLTTGFTVPLAVRWGGRSR